MGEARTGNPTLSTTRLWWTPSRRKWRQGGRAGNGRSPTSNPPTSSRQQGQSTPAGNNVLWSKVMFSNQDIVLEYSLLISKIPKVLLNLSGYNMYYVNIN